jgi:hypothetical protein
MNRARFSIIYCNYGLFAQQVVSELGSIFRSTITVNIASTKNEVNMFNAKNNFSPSQRRMKNLLIFSKESTKHYWERRKTPKKLTILSARERVTSCG